MIVLGLKKYALAISYALVIASTLYCTHVYHGYKEAKVIKQQTEILVRDRDIARKSVLELNTDLATLRKAYITIGKKTRETKLTASPCTLTPDAIGLWNQSILGTEVLPDAASGTAGVGGASIADAFDNKQTNDEIYNRNKARNKKLKKWVKDTFGEQ